MWFRSGLYILIFYCHSNVAFGARCQDGEILSQSKNEIAHGEIADHVGYCSHHASRDLLHQALCSSKAENCFQPAVLDFIAVEAENKTGPAPYHTLSKILLRQSVSSETCLAMNNLFEAKSGTDNYRDYEEKFQKAINRVAKRECEGTIQVCSRSVNAILPDKFVNFIKSFKCKGYEKNDPRQWVNYALDAVARERRNRSCPEISIPNFRIVQQPYKSTDPASMSAQINRVLAAGHQVKVGIRSPHALVISNYRMICMNGNATLQYQTLDSLYNTRWSNSKKPGDWIDGNTLASQIDHNGTFDWLLPK